MPNTTGGKNYKKSKHSSGSFAPAFIDRQPDQVYARIIKILGNLNLLAYCNDNKTRICHIRGSMRKKVWINIGDIVLISVRDFEKDTNESGKAYEKADIVAKYDNEHMSKLKKMPDINQKLFLQLETADGTVLNEIGRREQANPPDVNDYGIEFDYSDVKDRDKEGGSAESKDSDSEREFDIDDI
jgi:translation initiation factor 1A